LPVLRLLASRVLRTHLADAANTQPCRVATKATTTATTAKSVATAAAAPTWTRMAATAATTANVADTAPTPIHLAATASKTTTTVVSSTATTEVTSSTRSSVAYKRKVLLNAEDIDNSAAGRQFAVNEGSIRGWRRHKQALFACNGTRRSFRSPKNDVFADVEA
ncbi:hypothetical protein HPB47_023068, partial [Ixodes persulcatus]